ncbi:MAG: hypothetical protein WBV82_09235, partial [Myxococcaceae bacterium]
VDEPVWRELCAAGSAPPPPAPEEAIASLSEASSTEDRMRAMRSFAERWFGADPDAPPLDGSVSVPLPHPDWHTSRTRFFGSNGVIGFAYPDADQFWVWLGAKDRTRLEAIEDLVEDWPDLGF